MTFLVNIMQLLFVELLYGRIRWPTCIQCAQLETQSCICAGNFCNIHFAKAQNIKPAF